ncbi:hypothetical protein DSL72_004396 [Monilinia vaccinii-corymbosi]|uniref:Uncharacterized protein n=1 Tax=Monilinia vaccinii-corymbosi TaxID=61207 RepID=A0A8A3P7C8_9HELO|nr:hypothetical protein DSL72_004396 [Monilinia vaccinii-corymbosi]
MRVSIPTLINLSLVALAAAQAPSSNSTTSCVSSYQHCLDNGGADNTCQSENAKCKDECSKTLDSCLKGDGDKAACNTSYNTCLNDFSVFTTAAGSAGKDCASIFSACHDAGTPDNTCNSIAAQCKDKCSTIYGTALTSGNADANAAMTQYNNCLDSFSDKCSTIYGICLTSGDAENQLCMGQYNNCLSSFTPITLPDCVSAYTCKDDCSSSYSTCLSSGDPAMKAPCLQQYNKCYVTFTWQTNTTVPVGQDCVSKYLSATGEDNERNAVAATCKTACSTSYSTCLTSGDQSLKQPCMEQYSQCLVNFNAPTTRPDCASTYLSCTEPENTCASKLAGCKNTCSVALDIALSSGDQSVVGLAQKRYQACLASFTAATDAIGKDCVGAYTSCRAGGGADNDCGAGMASCKNKCSSLYDIFNTATGNSSAYDYDNTSADNSTVAAPQALHLYDSCLVSFNTNETTPAGQDCASKYYNCGYNNLKAKNECNADYATCKNDCAVILDACKSSGDQCILSMCDNLYNLCLNPVVHTNITSNYTIPIVDPKNGNNTPPPTELPPPKGNTYMPPATPTGSNTAPTATFTNGKSGNDTPQNPTNEPPTNGDGECPPDSTVPAGHN